MRPVLISEDPEESIVANQKLSYYDKEASNLGQYLGDVASNSEKESYLREGKGFYRHLDGQAYLGEWSKGKMHGFGKLYFSDEKLRYQG